VWNEPLAEKCTECDWPILTMKTTKRRGTEKVCPQRECGFSEPAESSGANEPVEEYSAAG